MDVARAAKDTRYAKSRKEILGDHGLNCWAISNHLAGQLVCDPNDDARSDLFAPKECHGDAEKKRQWAVQTMKYTALAAKNIGVQVVNGFTGSSIWHMLYSFPPVSDQMIEEASALRGVVEPDPGRVRRVRRPLRAGGASHGDRLRH